MINESYKNIKILQRINIELNTTGYLILLWAWLAGCSAQENEPGKVTTDSFTQTIFYGGDIISMVGDRPEYLEALVQKEGKIIFTGSKEQAFAQFESSSQQVDLQGKTLVPGFIDGHAHFFGFGAQAVGANLLASPDGTVNSIDELIDELKDWHHENGTDKSQGWIFGLGYDDAILQENRHPTRDDLDKVSMEVPVMVIHISGHFCSVNSKALEMLGITKETSDPEGGVIRRREGTAEPNGVLEELAAIPNMFKVISPKDPELADYYLDQAQQMAASFGYTTAQEGRAMTNHEQLAGYATRGKLNIDVVSYIDYSFSHYLHTPWNSKDYQNHYRVGGIKLTLDGSPQGRTAWRTIPYLLPPDGQQQGYKGYPAIPDDEQVQAIIDSAFANKWQLLAHTNGDAAVDQLLRTMKPVAEKYGNNNRRNVLIHGQLIRMDQLDGLKELDILASFFPMHTFYWGDWYKQIIGPEQANQISPIKTALSKGIRVTSHTDAPVALPNLMMILHTTVNRLSRTGSVIGESERLTTYEALKCITIWSAYQHFEEGHKGTLEPGKLADMVILDRNPIKVNPVTLKDIKVLETIKEGATIYRRDTKE
jgi:predicted amidohydrolase YtcJ